MREADMLAESFKENFMQTGTAKGKIEQTVRNVVADCDALCQRAEITPQYYSNPGRMTKLGVVYRMPASKKK